MSIVVREPSGFRISVKQPITTAARINLVKQCDTNYIRGYWLVS